MPEITSSASVAHLNQLIQFVSSHAETAQFPIQRIREIELAVEETLVNIFSYAYPDTRGTVSIACRIGEDQRLIVEISDNGIPFNALDVPDPDRTAAISDRRVGGLGVFFVKEMADNAQYRLEKGRNILTLVFDKRRRGAKRQEHASGAQE
jgi:serine/threonine-protein kinase RsbW